MTPDQHLDGYLSSMRRNMGDKTFFLPMLPKDVTTIADFGCADGSLLTWSWSALAWDRKPYLLGYDHDERMVTKASARIEALPTECRSGRATSSYPMFRRALQEERRKGRKVCLVFSSVLHEWLGNQTHGDLVDLIEELDPEFIAIRDMATVRTGRKERGELQDMLKSAYPANAEEEAKEDYFALSPMDLVLALPGYSLRHLSYHLPDYIRRGVNQRHGVWLDEPTHVTILLARR